MAVACPRVPAVLSRPSSPGEATILFQKEGAVAVVCPRVPAVLSRPSSPGEATILSEKDLDWPQSGVVFPPPPAPHKGRRSVPWRQVKRRERRAALTAWAPIGGCTNLIIEKWFMRWFAARTRREVSGCPVRRRKELPLLNLWRRSRKAINRDLHALNGNTSTPVASTVRNVRPRLEMVNDDDMDASLAPTLAVPPTAADPANRFFLPGAVGGLETVGDDDLDNLLPGTYILARRLRTAWEVCSRKDVSSPVLWYAQKRTSMTWASSRPLRRLRSISCGWCPIGVIDQSCSRWPWVLWQYSIHVLLITRLWRKGEVRRGCRRRGRQSLTRRWYPSSVGRSFA